MRLARIEIEGLFGAIDFDTYLDGDEPATVLHGPNGCGKTTVLEMITALFDGDPWDLLDVPFSRFALELRPTSADSDASTVTLSCEPCEAGLCLSLDADQTFTLQHADEDPKRHSRPRLLTWLEEVERRRKSTAAADVHVAIETLLLEQQRHKESLVFPGWYGELRDAVDTVFLESHRLLTADANSAKFEPAVLVYSEQIREFLARCEAGAEDVPPGLESRVDLMRDIVNERLVGKRLEITSANGYEVHTTGGMPLDLEDLSTGEQHLLVIFHRLLFHARPGAIALVDEPELSLHIDWQDPFLSDIARVVELVPMSVLVATHSPDLVSDKWHWTVAMEVPQAWHSA